VGVMVRLIFLGSMPNGFNQDEASIGYDAYSILNFGIDRNGIPNPIHLIAWGSGQNALYAYFCMPFIHFLGLNVLSIRLVSALFGSISLVVFYLLVKEISNKKIALLSMFLLAICPWGIMSSRWALESNLFPPMFLIGLYLLILSFKHNRVFLLASMILASCFYAYGTSYFFLPLFLTITLIYIKT